jgi:hypothetical protein
MFGDLDYETYGDFECYKEKDIFWKHWIIFYAH